ncbi:hypothetical protein [Vibrio algarum]|uniref:DUF3570 domain-containing protein n=1 Tax=Vibrio algarum TaxID=3020714 RepID=A0ABT4YWH7_9VIBR|nr:hypothetical protein [Vibrio sp. KJ40-1]MDB1125511.1 hypothetical protein [Vibrio sp. KJ40-1]
MKNLERRNEDKVNLYPSKARRQMSSRFCFLIICMHLTVVSTVYGQTSEEIEVAMTQAGESEPVLSTDSSYPDDTSWIEATEDYFSETVHDFSTFLDQGLAKDDDEEALVNRSYLKLRYRAEYSHHGYFTSDERVSIRIDLPHVKRNWNLILETDPDDYDSLESKQRGLPSDASKNSLDGAIGGVRLQDEELLNWRTNLDLGVKIRLPFDPFVRGELLRVGELSENWTAQFKQDVFYYHSLGSGSLTELNFYHALAEDHTQIFKVGSSAQYIYEDDNWELLFQLKYFDRISSDHLLEYSTGVSIEPNKGDEVSNSWISASWRQKLYSNWLYLSLTPQVDAPRELDYKYNVGFQLELEAVFSKNRSLDRLNRFIPRSTRVTD